MRTFFKRRGDILIDIHTHIIPSVDDGSSSLDESLKIIELLKAEGVDEVVCTSHQDMHHINKELLEEGFHLLKHNTSMKLYLGSEIFYYDAMIKDLNEGRLLSINNSKYILVEFSFFLETPIEDIIFDLVVAGYKPIIAHIERYEYLSFKDYDKIRNAGALIQVNSRSFERKEYKKIIKYLLKNDLIDFIASDCHNQSSRSPSFAAAKKYIMKKYKDRYSKYFENNFKFGD